MALLNLITAVVVAVVARFEPTVCSSALQRSTGGRRPFDLQVIAADTTMRISIFSLIFIPFPYFVCPLHYFHADYLLYSILLL